MSRQSTRVEWVSRFLFHPDGDIEARTKRGSRRFGGADVGNIAIDAEWVGFIVYALTLTSGDCLLFLGRRCDILKSLLDSVPNADVAPTIRSMLEAHLRITPEASAATDSNTEVFRRPSMLQIAMLLLGAFIWAGGGSGPVLDGSLSWGMYLAGFGGFVAALYHTFSMRYVADSRGLAVRSLFFNRRLKWDEIAVVFVQAVPRSVGFGKSKVLSVMPVCGAGVRLAFVRRNADLMRLMIRRVSHAYVDPAVSEQLTVWPHR